MRCRTDTKHQIDAFPASHHAPPVFGPRATGSDQPVGGAGLQTFAGRPRAPQKLGRAKNSASTMSDVPLTTLVELLAEVCLEDVHVQGATLHSLHATFTEGGRAGYPKMHCRAGYP